ncbi:hypothetical protein GCM10022287_19670 [Gryllotalpicola koreensis]|uniref:O-antigen ligase domain-containing protein n=2 Tax=Gryllotalpicola koreensis TaxID=993086 RepID=A0ABP8A0J6_9MICO
MFILGVLVIALQRVGVPAGSFIFPVAPLILLVFLAILFVRGAVAVSGVALSIWAIFVAFALALSATTDTSVTSVIQIALLWLPIAVLPRNLSSNRFLAGAVLATSVSGAFGFIQSTVSAAMPVFPDPLASLPSSILVPGFNDTYAVVWGGHWMKANGGLFLEPSFLSLFSALALLAVLTGAVRVGRWRVICMLTLLAGLLSSVAVSGLVLAPVFLVWAIVRMRQALPYAIGIVIAIPLIRYLPQTAAIVDRATNVEGTSDSMRLVLPYTNLVPQALQASPLVGLGPGSAHAITLSLAAQGSDGLITTPTAAKMIYEYGLVGVVFLALAVLYLGTRSNMPGLFVIAVLVALIVPTDGLTSGVLVPVSIFALTRVSDRDLRAQRIQPTSELARIPARRELITR